MFRFILTRLSLVIPTFIGMTLLAFLLIRLVPGDPIETMAGERGIDPARHAQLLKEYGLDKPILVQYGIYIGRVLHLDLGKSVITQAPVLQEFIALFPATIELAVCAILFALLLGIPAGIIAAVKRNSIFDQVASFIANLGMAVPNFWMALLFILLFSVQLRWLPVGLPLPFLILTPVARGLEALHELEGRVLPLCSLEDLQRMIDRHKGKRGIRRARSSTPRPSSSRLTPAPAIGTRRPAMPVSAIRVLRSSSPAMTSRRTS